MENQMCWMDKNMLFHLFNMCFIPDPPRVFVDDKVNLYYIVFNKIYIFVYDCRKYACFSSVSPEAV